MTINSGNSLLAWGVMTAITALVIGHLWMHCGGPIWNFLWITIFITGSIASRLVRKKGLPEDKTPLGKVIGRGYLIAGIAMCVIGLGSGMTQRMANIVTVTNPTPVIAIIIGIATAFMGSVLNSRIIMVTGVLGGVCGYFAGLFFTDAYSMVVAGVTMVCLVLPGAVIKLQNRRSC